MKRQKIEQKTNFAFFFNAFEKKKIFRSTNKAKLIKFINLDHISRYLRDIIILK